MAKTKVEEWEGKSRVVVESRIRKESQGLAKEFYLINLKDNKVTKIEGGLLWNHDVDWFGLVSSDSQRVYAVGSPHPYIAERFAKVIEKIDDDGDGQLHRGASVLDLSSALADSASGIECKWVDISEGMLVTDRPMPGCVILCDKLFVFCGDKYGGSPGGFGEYYDLSSENGGWKPIPLPGIKEYSAIWHPNPVITDAPRNRLLVYFHLANAVHAYYPDEHRWECFDKDASRWWIHCPVACTVQGLILFAVKNGDDYDHETISAFDIETKKFVDVKWVSSTPFGSRTISRENLSNIISLGDDTFCFPDESFHKAAPDRAGIFTYHFYRFKVRRQSKHLAITPLSIHHFPVPGASVIDNVVSV